MTTKRLSPIIFFMVIFSACSSSEDETRKDVVLEKEVVKLKNNTLEALGESFITSLKEHNSLHLQGFLPSTEDIENIVMIYDGTDEDRKKILAGSKENSEKIKENTHNAFEHILKKGEDVGITWESVAFDKVEYNITPQNNIEYASLTIIFKYKVLAYKITIAECINTKEGWLIFDKPIWKG